MLHRSGSQLPGTASISSWFLAVQTSFQGVRCKSSGLKLLLYASQVVFGLLFVGVFERTSVEEWHFPHQKDLKRWRCVQIRRSL